MFAFLELGAPPQNGFFKMLSRVFRHDFGAEIKVEHFLNMPYMHVVIDDLRQASESRQRKQLLFIKEVLGQNNIREVCFSVGFPFREEFLNERFFEVGERSLNEALMCEMAFRFADDGEKTAAIFSKQIYRKERELIFKLSEKFRFLLICTEGKTGSVGKELRESCGVAAIFSPGKKRILAADVALFFDRPYENAELSEDCVVILADDEISQYVSGGKRAVAESLSLPERIKDEIKDNVPVKKFISEAIRTGAANPEEIGIEKIEVRSFGNRAAVLDKRQ